MCLVMVLLRALSLLPHSRGVGVPAAAPTPAVGAPPPASANGQPPAAVNGAVTAAAGNGAATGARPPMRWTNSSRGLCCVGLVSSSKLVLGQTRVQGEGCKPGG